MVKPKVDKEPIERPNYAEAYQKARSEGRLTRKTSRILTWTEDSPHLIGKVRAIMPFTGGKFEAEVNAYLIETDQGLVSTILGSYTDSQLAGLDLVGKIVVIEYEGKKDLEDGRKVNLFNVDIMSEVTPNGT